MQLYNSLTEKTEEFTPLNPPKVTVYACSPTAHDNAHIGNFRTYVMTDILVRALNYFDYEVLYDMNITDIDHLISDADEGEFKLEENTHRENISARKNANYNTEAFLNDCKLLNLTEPHVRSIATEHIKEQLDDDQIDIFTGGADFTSFHHTDEILQSEIASGKKSSVRYWIHDQFINVDGEKISKSKGNCYTLKDITNKSYHPLSLKYFYLTTHYRSYLNFTWQALENAQKSFNELLCQAKTVRKQSNGGKRMQLSEEKLEKTDFFRNKFDSAVNNDINMPEAIAIVWETVKSNIPSHDKYDLLVEFDRILGLKMF